MPPAPLITILLPVYNGAAYLKEALESMLQQTQPDFELLLINDGSTDRSMEIARAFQDARIRIIGDAANRGSAVRLNEGLNLARGLFVARMDADDISHPERLRLQTRFMASRPDIGICGTWYRTFGRGQVKEARLFEEHDQIAARALFSSPFAHPTVMFNLAHLHRYNLRYPVAGRFAQDVGLWVRARHYVRMANVPEFLLDYRIHEGGVSMRYAAEQEEAGNFARECGLILEGLNFSKSELNLHNKLSTHRPLLNQEEVDGALAWLRRLGRSAGAWGRKARALRRECNQQADGVVKRFIEIR